jgi:hypothetical protein
MKPTTRNTKRQTIKEDGGKGEKRGKKKSDRPKGKESHQAKFTGQAINQIIAQSRKRKCMKLLQA